MAPAPEPTAVYLDHNATTPLAPEAAAAMAACLAQPLGNPASQHAPGRAARRVLEGARSRLLELLGASAGGMRIDRLVFTSGGTEASALAVTGLAALRPGRVLVSAIEHPSVAAAADRLVAEGRKVERIAVDAAGVVRLDGLDELLAAPGPVALVSVMLASNETGVVQPVTEVARQAHAVGALVHTDAVQAVGKINVNFTTLGVDALSLTAHKFHGPVGIGALVLRAGVEPTPLLVGGFQQGGLRAGIEPVALACGMAAALGLHSDGRSDAMRALLERLERALLAGEPTAVIVGADAERLPHTSCIAFPGADRQALVMALDLAGVACSTGSACASGSSEPSPTLLAMGISNLVVQGAIRLSLGAFTTAQEVDWACRRILSVVNDLRRPKRSGF